MAVTTVKIECKNLRLLKILKSEMGAKSYNEVIERLLIEKTSVPDDLFGVNKGKISKFTEEDRL